MRQIFCRTNLPRCERDWCTEVLVGQYLTNHRKNLKKAAAAAARVVDTLPDGSSLEAEYQREAALTANGADPHGLDDDDIWADEEDDDVGAAAGEAGTAASSEEGSDVDDD
jgi:hypothetical protein